MFTTPAEISPVHDDLSGREPSAAGPIRELDFLKTWRFERFEVVETRSPHRGHFDRLILEDHPRIDIRYIGLLEHLDEGPPLRLVYIFRRFENLRVYLIVKRTGEGLLATLTYIEFDTVMEQRVEIVIRSIRGRRRPMFICPNTEAPVEVLAFREGMFASAKAQGLVNRSQVGANRVRRKKTSTAAKAEKKAKPLPT